MLYSFQYILYVREAPIINWILRLFGDNNWIGRSSSNLRMEFRIEVHYVILLRDTGAVPRRAKGVAAAPQWNFSPCAPRQKTVQDKAVTCQNFLLKL